MLTTDELKQLFPSFEPDLLSAISRHATIKDFKEGEVIMRTGQYLRSALLVINGLVKIFREDDEGNEYFMYYLQPAEACALSMICATCQQTSQLKAVASTNTQIIAIPLQYMEEWMHTFKTWNRYVLESYMTRFQELLVTIDQIAFRNMDERLLFYLKRQQKTLNKNILTLNYTEVAQELNSSREVISRLMKKLAEKGMIHALKNQQIEIINLNID